MAKGTVKSLLPSREMRSKLVENGRLLYGHIALFQFR